MKTNIGKTFNCRSIFAICVSTYLYITVCAPVRFSAPAEQGPRSCIALKGEEGALLLPTSISSKRVEAALSIYHTDTPSHLLTFIHFMMVSTYCIYESESPCFFFLSFLQINHHKRKHCMWISNNWFPAIQGTDMISLSMHEKANRKSNSLEQ